MATIDSSYFFDHLLIPQSSDATVASSIQRLIDSKEPELLTQMLGYELNKAYTAGIGAGSPLAKWTDLRDGKEYTTRQGYVTKWRGLKFTDGSKKKSLIANYVYWYWMEGNATVTTGTGEKVADNVNAISVSPGQKMANAWNEMVYMIRELYEFLLSNPADYPEFQDYWYRVPTYLITPVNTMNI